MSSVSCLPLLFECLVSVSKISKSLERMWNSHDSTIKKYILLSKVSHIRYNQCTYHLYSIYRTIVRDLYPLVGCIWTCIHTHTCHVSIDRHLHSNPFYMKVTSLNILLVLHIHIGLQRYMCRKTYWSSFTCSHTSTQVDICVYLCHAFVCNKNNDHTVCLSLLVTIYYRLCGLNSLKARKFKITVVKAGKFKLKVLAGFSFF